MTDIHDSNGGQGERFDVARNVPPRVDAYVGAAETTGINYSDLYEDKTKAESTAKALEQQGGLHIAMLGSDSGDIDMMYRGVEKGLKGYTKQLALKTKRFMGGIVGGPGELQSVLSAEMKRLTNTQSVVDQIPSFAGQKNPPGHLKRTNSYLFMDNTGVAHVHYANLMEDVRRIETLIGTTGKPKNDAFLRSYSGVLKSIAKLAPQNIIHSYDRRTRDLFQCNECDENVHEQAKGSARMLVVLAVLAMAVFSTLNDIKKRQITMATLAYFGVAALLANPHMLAGKQKQFIRRVEHLKGGRFNQIIRTAGLNGTPGVAVHDYITGLSATQAHTLAKAFAKQGKSKPANYKERVEEELSKKKLHVSPDILNTLLRLNPLDAEYYISSVREGAGTGQVKQLANSANREHIRRFGTKSSGKRMIDSVRDASSPPASPPPTTPPPTTPPPSGGTKTV